VKNKRFGVVDVANVPATACPFTTLSPTDQQQLNDTLKRKNLAKGAYYFLPSGDKIAYLLPLSGTLLWCKEHPDKRIPMLFALPVGKLWRVTPINTHILGFVEAVEAGVLGLLTEADFGGLCRHSPTLCHTLITSLLNTLAYLTEEYYQRATAQLNVRLAGLLLAQCEWHEGKPIIFKTHKYLAGLLGANRESITVILGQYGQKGWVDLAPRRIMLLDMPALQALSRTY
jgi:hypothetical protein